MMSANIIQCVRFSTQTMGHLKLIAHTIDGDKMIDAICCTYRFFKKEFDLNLPWRPMLGIDHTIANIEWSSRRPQITVHETFKPIRNGERWWTLYIFTSFQRAHPKVVAEYKARCWHPRRVQC